MITHGEEETIAYAREYAGKLERGDIVLLYGDMGAGKTVFAKGIAEGLGIRDEVVSPTYAYVNDYGGILYHFDCYRLESGEQAEAMGLCDYFYAGGICLIEWPQNIRSVLPESAKRIDIRKISGDEREITVT